MAPPSPRRSSRARPTATQSQQSSVSSSASGRLERNSRSLNKPSSGKSTPSASLSSEPLEDLDDTLLGRRRKRGQDDEPERSPSDNIVMTTGEDIQDEEDEAVRCICGSEEYPGPPPVDAPEADFFLAHELTEDVTGFFVQCDVCKVWQHGACVGIFSAEASPDEYFCEQCRKESHKILVADNGQRYSKYLPLQRQSRATSRATSVAKEGTRSPKSSSSKTRQDSASLAAAKRRSTMNSRDAAYDDEQLRRAIEASREANALDAVEGSIRRPKRGRSDSEGNLSHVKRQRTSSRSASPPVEQPEAPSRNDSDDDSTRNSSKKPRNARPQREKEEKEDRERLRQEAASKRKGRAERRRAEDSELSEEMPLAAAKATVTTSVETPSIVEPPPPIIQPTPDTPPTMPAAVGSSHKRGARSNHKKTKGKNQYTKEREPEPETSPARSMSRDIQKNTEEPVVAAPPKSAPVDHKPASKSKQAMATKMSMTDMRRRVGAIMDFISRTQVDLAAEATPNNSGASSTGQASPQKATAQTNGFPDKPDGDADTGNGATPESLGKDFKELNCMEMMDVLTRDMVKWQNQYA